MCASRENAYRFALTGGALSLFPMLEEQPIDGAFWNEIGRENRSCADLVLSGANCLHPIFIVDYLSSSAMEIEFLEQDKCSAALACL